MKKIALLVCVIMISMQLSSCGTLNSEDDDFNETIKQSTQQSHTHTIKHLEAKKATCTETGMTDGQQCSTCNKMLVRQTILPMLGHDWVDGTCNRCGAIEELLLDPQDNNVLTIQQINWEINSVGGVEPNIRYTNKSGKQIAYICFTLRFYDRMGNPAKCSIYSTDRRRLQITGPINGYEQDTGYWDAIFYDGTVGAIKPLEIEIEYSDGTKKKITCTGGTYWFSSKYYGGELKD